VIRSGGISQSLTVNLATQQAIADLGKALEDAGYRREAVNAHIRFSQLCGGHAASLRTAREYPLETSDYAKS